MTRNLMVTTLVAAVMAGFVLIYTALTPASAQPSMGGSSSASGVVPSVSGYVDGQEIRFVHTEVSSPKVARILTDMTSSKVLVVPSLKDTPKALTANVYVFTNGIKDGGPLKFQRDVFDRPPGTPGYRPLRALNLVTWKNPQAARILQAVAEVKAAAQRGELTITQPGIVLNMPILTWPGGKR